MTVEDDYSWGPGTDLSAWGAPDGEAPPTTQRQPETTGLTPERKRFLAGALGAGGTGYANLSETNSNNVTTLNVEGNML